MSSTTFASTQKLGRALMLPIAVLPVASLLLRFGQPDLLNIPFIATAGNAIFANLGLLFAVGIAVGFAKENNGAAGLAGLVGFLIAQKGAVALAGLDADAASAMEGRIAVPIGILIGICAGLLYNAYKDIKLPDYLGFFSGRRFIPIITGFAGLVVASVFGFGWEIFDTALTGLTDAIAHLGYLGLFLYGCLNRLFLITGLHHILNNVVWFLLGSYQDANAQVVTGDLNRFFASDPSAGAFMSGFFPIMMFGLPAACLAMYKTALPENRPGLKGLLISVALMSFLTGITEPIEFMFVFLAPGLFAIHAVLTGICMALMSFLGIKLGFGFSAGLIDYLLNFGISTKPLLLIPVGLGVGVLYYVIFVAVIKVFDLQTVGRKKEDPQTSIKDDPLVKGSNALSYIQALGGAANIVEVDSCATRLRLKVRSNKHLSYKSVEPLGAFGMIKPTPEACQVVVGPVAEKLAGEMRAILKES